MTYMIPCRALGSAESLLFDLALDNASLLPSPVSVRTRESWRVTPPCMGVFRASNNRCSDGVHCLFSLSSISSPAFGRWTPNQVNRAFRETAFLQFESQHGLVGSSIARYKHPESERRDPNRLHHKQIYLGVDVFDHGTTRDFQLVLDYSHTSQPRSASMSIW